MAYDNVATGYRLPPPPIAELADAPPPPTVDVDPTGTWMLIMERRPYVTLAEQARPLLRLAGLRIDPATSSSTRPGHYAGLSLLSIADGSVRSVTGLPEELRIEAAHWAHDGECIALALSEEQGLSLWLIDVRAAIARRILAGRLNGALGTPFAWEPGGKSLLCRLIPPDRGAPPEAPKVPPGPKVQETAGEAAPARTYQDLLQSAYDELLFEYHATSELARVGLDGSVEPLGRRGLLFRADPSPDGNYILVEEIHRPYSYLVPCHRFPRRVDVLDRSGHLVRTLADLPLAENVPINFDAVPEGPRRFEWRGDAPAFLLWAEAVDGGDPRREAAVRDRLYGLAAPFAGEPVELFAFEYRYAGQLSGSGELMIVYERWWRTRRIRTYKIEPDRPGSGVELLFDRSSEDAYNDPGSFAVRLSPRGAPVLLTADGGRTFFLSGNGASPEGDRPFVDRYDLTTKQATRLWRSQPPYYERPVYFLDPEKGLLLIARESVTEPPNYFVRELKAGSERRLTSFVNPTPQLAGVYKELIRYRRADGVELTATLYLPPGRSPSDGPFPLLMWAYPREYKSADAAGQVRESPHRFVRLSWGSPLFMLMSGYAILDGPAMPIIGEGDQEANDTYVEQLAASARAAVDEVVRRGVARPDQIAVGGHSYGGFMTANLLAHTDLFCAGIARSGAYNRTLTPFGFQAEERTLWEAPQVYFAMSPFIHADKIKAPLLLIHGDADDNPGTFPMQSERMYNALKGLGARARLVLLPHESHHYRARESVMHMLWEMHTWLERHVKRAGTEAGEGAVPVRAETGPRPDGRS